MTESDNKTRRGRPTEDKLTREELIRILREDISLTVNEKLNPSLLQKLTGIERRNWKKVQDIIDSMNDVRNGVTSENIKSFPFPNIDEVFSLYYDKNPKKLKKLFQSLVDFVRRTWEKSITFDRVSEDYEIKLKEKDRIIEELQKEIKEVKEDTEFYKRMYEKV